MQFILKQITPPVVWNFLKLCYSNPSLPTRETHLFEGDDVLFKELVTQVDYYGEYGVGQSTSWVVENTSATVYSVDTSEDWIEAVKSNLKSSTKLNMEWVDLGAIGDWGYPRSYDKRDNFKNYIGSIWARNNKPELVLIDGRFRVCCFLYSLTHGDPGTKIIFDDYTNRPNYHVIEDFIKPIKTNGRQALFVVPEGLDYEDIERVRQKFLYVMD